MTTKKVPAPKTEAEKRAYFAAMDEANAAFDKPPKKAAAVKKTATKKPTAKKNSK